MSKEGNISLQNIDCNCNNCLFMIRDTDKYKESLSLHHNWQLDYFNTVRGKLIEKGHFWERSGEQQKANVIFDLANKMKFQFNRATCRIQYGFCVTFAKKVSFIPDTCQLDTQSCFQNRNN